MPVSFNTIPSGNGLMVPLFYAEVDNSAAFTPGNSNVALLFGQMLDSGTATAGKPVAVSSAAMAKALFGRGVPCSPEWSKRTETQTCSVRCTASRLKT
ncbi:hypothetical protein [Parasutterella excrementihominis]|uniref:hypothetical protein n=1 Tax=Parasutterella excrementihominis TaxID=487175 RepID=UPI00242EB20E|nr:hypothetical protein [Parasutterella excrementihominis]